MPVGSGVTWAQAASALAAAAQVLITATAGVIAYRAYGVNRRSSVEGRVARLDVAVAVEAAALGRRHVLRIVASAHNHATAAVQVSTRVPPLVMVHRLAARDLVPGPDPTSGQRRWPPEAAMAVVSVLSSAPLPAGVTTRDTVLVSLDVDPVAVGYRVELSIKLADVAPAAPDTWLAVTYTGIPRELAGLPPSAHG